VSLLAEVQFGREVCGELDAAEAREWLVTNGLGGFASGTVAGTATRRYHGLLIAALQPPVGRTLLVAGLDESVRYLESSFPLATNRWSSGIVSPSGYLQIESFFLEGTKPVWRYALADALLEKRVGMKQGENTTCVQYTLVRGNAPVEIDAKVLVNYRDFHLTTQAGDWRMSVEPVENGLRIRAFDGATPFYLKSAGASVQPRHEWYRDYFLPAEKSADSTSAKIVYSPRSFISGWTFRKASRLFSLLRMQLRSTERKRTPSNPITTGNYSRLGRNSTARCAPRPPKRNLGGSGNWFSPRINLWFAALCRRTLKA